MGKAAWLTAVFSVVAWGVSFAPCWSAQRVTWDFEMDESNWRPRAETVEVRRIPALGATETSQACLKVAGPLREGWNYAYSNRISMQERHWYRLSAWVRVDLVGPATPMPYLKCEFAGSGPARFLGMAVTGTYHDGKMGQWQRLTCEFEAPPGTGEGIVALEKGTPDPTEIHAYLDEVTVEPISEAQVYLQYSLAVLPEPLERVYGTHPRLYLDEERIERLRGAIQTTHAPLWSQIRQSADMAAEVNPPLYISDGGDDGQLWQRPVGNTLPYLALAYRLTGQRRYLEAAQRWALASCRYPTWGSGASNGTDLAAGHQLYGLALVYDWCYHDLEDSTRDLIARTLVSRGSAMFREVATGRAWWHRLSLQNRMWVNTCGLAVAGLALFDEVDEALLWIGLALQKFETTMNALGPDGASHEGIGYWEYGTEHMLKFMTLAKDLLGVDFYDHPWWRNTGDYCLYLSLPQAAWTPDNCVVDLADSPPHHWYGPDHILRHLAATYRNPHSQWLADRIDTANVEASNAQWLNLIWYDPLLRSSSPQRLPTLHQFEDLGIVSARSDWSGRENLVVFKCGPFIGHKAIKEFSFDPGAGHAHPDAGHFVVFGSGQWLIRDDGYRTKWTHQHNTLLVDGKGQFGEGGPAFAAKNGLLARAEPRLLGAISTPQYDHITGDAAQAYPPDVGLKRFVRHLLFVKPDVLLVLDEVLCETGKRLELRFHPWSTDGERAGNRYLIAGQQAVLRAELLTPEEVTMELANLPAEDKTGNPDELLTLRYTRTGRDWRNAVAFSWAPITKPPPTVLLRRDEDSWQFTIADRSVVFDWGSGKIVGF